MEALLQLAESENIAVGYSMLKSPILGFYWKPVDACPIIGLSFRLHTDRRLHRCVLAEEIGHHFTSSGVRIAKKHHSIQDRLSIDKCEYKALWWAAHHLVPENDLLDIVGEGLCEIWELAEHFNVTEEMMRFRLRLWGVKHTEAII